MTEIQPQADPILEKITRRLVEAFSPVSVYLFGSKPRGEPGSFVWSENFLGMGV